jgi:hypothetical protein
VVKVSLADFLSSFFIIRAFLPLASKKTMPLFVGSKKISQRQLLCFFTPTESVTENPHFNIWPLRNISNPTGWDIVEMCLKVV